MTGLATLCGLTVSVENGTTEQTDADGAEREVQEGRQGVGQRARPSPTRTAANLAISSGKAQIGMADSPVAAYQVKQSHGQFKLIGTSYGTAPYGIALPKGNGMTKPILDAAEAADGQRHVQVDPHEVGRPGRRHLEPEDQRRNQLSAMVRARAPPARPGRPDEISAIPVRHPGRWVAAVDRPRLSRSRSCRSAHQPRFQWGRRRPLPVRAAILHGARRRRSS